MAATYFAEKVAINISKTSPRDFPNGFQSASRFSRASCLSTANEQAEGSNAVAESTSDRMYEANQQALDADDGRASGPVSGHVADIVKDGPKKAVDMAENEYETAKQNMDGAWKAAKESAATEDDYHIDKDPAVLGMKNVEDTIDTREFRIIEENIGEELRRKANGYDKAVA